MKWLNTGINKKRTIKWSEKNITAFVDKVYTKILALSSPVKIYCEIISWNFLFFLFLSFNKTERSMYVSCSISLSVCVTVSPSAGRSERKPMSLFLSNKYRLSPVVHRKTHGKQPSEYGGSRVNLNFFRRKTVFTLLLQITATPIKRRYVGLWADPTLPFPFPEAT